MIMCGGWFEFPEIGQSDTIGWLQLLSGTVDATTPRGFAFRQGDVA